MKSFAGSVVVFVALEAVFLALLRWFVLGAASPPAPLHFLEGENGEGGVAGGGTPAPYG